MTNLKQNYCKKSNYKDQLWNQLSSQCSGGHWCYSFSERRLFFLMFFIAFVLFIIYFSGIVTKSAQMSATLNSTDKVNSEKLYLMNNQNPSSLKVEQE